VTDVRFVAPELRADGTVALAPWSYERVGEGWLVRRDDVPMVELGPGYRLLETSVAGICATDLARVHLPFPLPQIVGHEVVALDAGRLVVVEINASHRARGFPRSEWCPRCLSDMDTHCPDRLVLGIDRLPGGFAPWILAPVGAIVPVPDDLDPRSAVFAEPFAAAWHAAEVIDAPEGTSIGVLGLGRLGLLCIAALDAWRRRRDRSIEVVGVARRPERGALACRLGADRWMEPTNAAAFDVVIDATGDAVGLITALAMARREVHLKSTSGMPAAGLADPTGLVVDEITLVPDRGGAVDAVAESVAEIDALRTGAPSVAPRARIALAAAARADGPISEAIVGRGVVLSTSRCGTIPDALPGLVATDERLGGSLADILVTAHVPRERLADGFRLARDPAHVKVLVQGHDRS